MLHNGKQTFPLGFGNKRKRIHRNISYFTLRLVDDTLQTQVIIGIVYDLQICKNIFYFFSVIESVSAKHTIRYTASDKRIFYVV